MKKGLLLLLMLLSLTGTKVLAVSEEDRQRYDLFFLDAMIERQKGNLDAAFDLLCHCIEINPEASEAYFFIAQYYTKLRDQDKALEFFKKAADLEAGNATYQETLAQAYAVKSNFAEAASVIEQLYDRHRDREDLLEMLYRLYVRQDDYDNAIRILDKLETMEGKSERLTYAKCEMYNQQGNKVAALAEVKSLADRFPNDMTYLGLYADQLRKNGEDQQALDIYQHILQEEPENTLALYSLMSHYKSINDSVMADSLTRRLLFSKNTDSEDRVRFMRQIIIESERQSSDSSQVLGLFRDLLAQEKIDVEVAMLYTTYMSLKQMPNDSITPVLQKILTAEPDNAAARLQLVAYAWDANEMDTIINLCQAARQYNPDEMEFYYFQGMAYYKKDEQDNALNAFRNGISVINEESDPGIVSDFYAVMGDLLQQKGLTREAFAAYDSCLQHKPDNIGCLNNYAYYLSVMGQELEKAEHMSYKTIKAEPQNPTYLDTYAWILFMQHRYSEAKIYIDQTLQNDTDTSAVILEHAGDIYCCNKEIERALEFWKEALSKSPDNKLLIRKIKLKKYIKE